MVPKCGQISCFLPSPVVCYEATSRVRQSARREESGMVEVVERSWKVERTWECRETGFIKVRLKDRGIIVA